MTAGLHSVLTSDGKMIYFFLEDGELIPDKYLEIYLKNLEINIARVPQWQQSAMRQRANEMKAVLISKKRRRMSGSETK